MLCDVCHKIEASVHLTEIINDKVMKLNLCEECAMKKSSDMEEHFGLGELLAGLTEFGESVKAPTRGTVKIKCPNCGLTYSDFKRRGRLGCSECYNAFQSKLTPLLKRLHGSEHHVGKVPIKVPDDIKTEAVSKLQELRLKLKKAIAIEEFEEAAKLRDQIRDLEAEEKNK